MTNFLTIRQAAKELAVPECFIRRQVKSHAAEGFYSGNRFYINVSAFREALDRKSRANVRADAAQ